MIALLFQKELILLKQLYQRYVIFVIIGVSLNKNFEYEPYLCNDCHDLMQKALNFNIAFASAKGSDYRIHFQYMNKDGVINIIKNSNLNEKNRLI